MIMKVRHQRKDKDFMEITKSISKDERKKRAGWKPKADAKLFQKMAGKNCSTDACSSSKNLSGFSLPEQKRLLFVNVQKWTNSNVSVAAVEVLNEFNLISSDVLQSSSQDKCTRINGYNHASKVVWTVFNPRIVSLLSSNSCWTVLSTFEGHLMCLSTQTGRMLFCAAVQPICIMTLKGDNCMVVDCRGQLTCWNLLKYRSQSSQCISQLFNSESQQLVAPFLSGEEDSPV
uniref:Uncharacterized protein n=1 Tax=Ditylenchus dipsaci TaxID=166011 RepID=A0A915DZS2_9BILA